MNELERIALNEILRTVTYIAEEKGEKEMLEEFLERIAKSLEFIDAELKARNSELKELLEASGNSQKLCEAILHVPLGIQRYKEKALADRVKQKE